MFYLCLYAEDAVADQEQLLKRPCSAQTIMPGQVQGCRHVRVRFRASLLDWVRGRCADGNKLFQSEFIGIIYPGADLVQQLEFNLLNSSVALFGYYLAAFTIDLPWMGRRGMQAPHIAGSMQ